MNKAQRFFKAIIFCLGVLLITLGVSCALFAWGTFLIYYFKDEPEIAALVLVASILVPMIGVTSWSYANGLIHEDKK